MLSKRKRFLNQISNGNSILADGAMGTMLHDDGLPLKSCIDQLNLTDPQRIIRIHEAYLQSGAQILETNTFGANRYKLAQFDLLDRIAEINRAGVEVAKKAIDRISQEAFIAGSVGPLGVHLAPYGRIKPEEALCAFQDQIHALSQAGADLIIIETQTDLREAIQAVEAAQSVADDLPIIATMTFTRDDRTLLGDTPIEVAKQLLETGADIIGVNCSTGPAQILRILKQMKQAVPQAHFSAMPNAGWPEQIDGRIFYSHNPEYFAQYACAFHDIGASVIGGCCGTTPKHIAAARDALNQPQTHQVLVSPVKTVNVENSDILPGREPTRLASQLENGNFVITVEMNPPHGSSTQKLIASAEMLAEAGADTINLTDSPMARMRMSPWGACQIIQDNVGIETILHFPTRGRNLLRIQGDLLAAHALGVRNIFVVMGDPTSIGDYPEAMDSYDVVPSGLIRLIHQGFNTGKDQAGGEIGDATSFFTGCALNLAAKDLPRETRILKKKIDAGAHFALTQPIYDPAYLHRFLDTYNSRYGTLDLPILIGILPLHSYRHAEFLHHEVPGIEIPEAIRKSMEISGADALKIGKEIAIELIEELQPLVSGVYLIPAFGRYQHAAELLESIRNRKILPESCWS
jgi:methionine synthase I (cobalamin-dependent)/5,10-methylenetetrahydrofolate reductase